MEIVLEGQDVEVMIHASPTTSEVAFVFVGQKIEKRDTILHNRVNKLKRISKTHHAYAALQCPLVYCRGKDVYIKMSRCVTSSVWGVIFKSSQKKTFSAHILTESWENMAQDSHILLHRSLLN